MQDMHIFQSKIIYILVFCSPICIAGGKVRKRAETLIILGADGGASDGGQRRGNRREGKDINQVHAFISIHQSRYAAKGNLHIPAGLIKLLSWVL